MRPATAHRPTAPTRQVVAAALALVVLGAIGAVKAGLTGADFMFDLEQPDHQPAIAKIDPVVVDPHTPRLARRVFLVIIDGLRLDKSYELPFLDELRRRGVDSEAQSHYPTWSRPNYVSILTGVPPEVSGVRTNHHSSPVELDSLMDRVRAAGMRAACGTDYDVLPRLFLRARGAGKGRLTRAGSGSDSGSGSGSDSGSDSGSGSDSDSGSDSGSETEAEAEIRPRDTDTTADPLSAAAVHAPDADLESPFADARYAPWPGGFSEAGAALAAGDDELVVLLVGAVDAAGHAHGGASVDYREAAENADRALARALGRVDLTQDAIVVTADHGHTNRGGHGGVEPEVLAVPLIAAGAGIVPGANAEDAHLIDLPPTVAALLGIPAPGHGLGRSLTELLALDGAGRAARQAADRERLAITRRTVELADARAATDELAHRAQRLALVGGGALLATALAILLVRRRVLRFDARVLVVSVPAFFIVYYALIGTLGQRFSPSLLPAQGHLAAAMAKYGLAAMVVQLGASLWALRNEGSLAERLAAANGIAWMGLTLAMLPAGLAWAFFPPPYVTVPGPVWLVLIPAIEVAVACAAVDVALTLLVEVIVFAARAWHKSAPTLDDLD